MRYLIGFHIVNFLYAVALLCAAGFVIVSLTDYEILMQFFK